jgi:hypothetical protein
MMEGHGSDSKGQQINYISIRVLRTRDSDQIKSDCRLRKYQSLSQELKDASIRPLTASSSVNGLSSLRTPPAQHSVGVAAVIGAWAAPHPGTLQVLAYVSPHYARLALDGKRSTGSITGKSKVPRLGVELPTQSEDGKKHLGYSWSRPRRRCNPLGGRWLGLFSGQRLNSAEGRHRSGRDYARNNRLTDGG